jgi:hypothetical protein
MTPCIETDAVSRLAPDAGTKPFSGAHLESMLRIRQIDAKHADNVRRWLRMALTHPTCIPDNQNGRTGVQAGILRLFRRAGETAIEASARSWLLKNNSEIGSRELEKGAWGLTRAVYEEIAAELRLEESAQFPTPIRRSSQADVKGSRNRALKYVTLQVIGLLSVLGLQQPLKEITERAICAASATVRLPGEPAGTTDRPVFPQQVVASADSLARKFGLPFGNTMFRKALVQPPRHPAKKSAVPESLANAALSTLGYLVVNDLADRAIIQSILSNPGTRDMQSLLRKEIDSDILIPAYDALGLNEILFPAAEARISEVSSEEKAQAVEAVMAAAYLSYKCNGIVLARHLPGPIRGWIDVMAQAVSQTGPPEPGTARRKQHRRSFGTEQGMRGKRGVPGNASKLPTAQPGQDGRGNLSLTRTPGQGILLGDDILIQVSRVVDRKVMIRIIAPKDLKVLRAELQE